MTPILKVITEYCAMEVQDDPIFEELALEDKPLYAWRMWGYLRVAIPHFTMPATMQEYLVGTEENPKLIEPTFNSYLHTVEFDITDSYTLELGEQYAGFDLFSCRQRVVDDFDRVIMLPADCASYDRETGTVTFNATAEYPIPEGTIFDMDFYADGQFVETLSYEAMKILGLCFQVVWQNRFNNDWISNVSKVEDKSFSEQNRANKMNADTARLKEIRTMLAEEMRKYEQNLKYRKIFPGRGLI